MHNPNPRLNKPTADDYEQLATDRLGEFRDESTSSYEDENALSESVIYAILAVNSHLHNIADELFNMRVNQ